MVAFPDMQGAPHEQSRTPIANRFELFLEQVLFNARWLLAPLYFGLVGGLAVIVIKFAQALVHLASNAVTYDLRETTLNILQLLDITLLGNLIVLVMFVGYENFVSKLDPAQGHDRPHWMGRVGFSGLKLKLIGSLVAISVIELLKDFLADSANGYQNEMWRIGLHLTFVFSGLIFAMTDWVSARAEKS